MSQEFTFVKQRRQKAHRMALSGMPKKKACTKRQVSPKELAEHYGVSIRTVTNWKAIGIVPFIRIGRVVRFDLDEVTEALDKYKVKVWDRTGKGTK